MLIETDQKVNIQNRSKSEGHDQRIMVTDTSGGDFQLSIRGKLRPVRIDMQEMSVIHCPVEIFR